MHLNWQTSHFSILFGAGRSAKDEQRDRGDWFCNIVHVHGIEQEEISNQSLTCSSAPWLYTSDEECKLMKIIILVAHLMISGRIFVSLAILYFPADIHGDGVAGWRATCSYARGHGKWAKLIVTKISERRFILRSRLGQYVLEVVEFLFRFAGTQPVYYTKSRMKRPSVCTVPNQLCT